MNRSWFWGIFILLLALSLLAFFFFAGERVLNIDTRELQARRIGALVLSVIVGAVMSIYVWAGAKRSPLEITHEPKENPSRFASRVIEQALWLAFITWLVALAALTVWSAASPLFPLMLKEMQTEAFLPAIALLSLWAPVSFMLCAYLVIRSRNWSGRYVLDRGQNT